jgi:DNA-directed RNA polymerase specialized sigma24 family protein
MDWPAKRVGNRKMMEPTIGSMVSQNLCHPPAAQRADEFDRFSRYRGLLHFIARRVVGSAEDAELAVHNSWLVTSRSRLAPGGESAFRSWLVRVLINEALAIVRRSGNS